MIRRRRREVETTGYKYLGILQLDQAMNAKMKDKIKSEYVRKVKKLCRSKLSGGNPDQRYQCLDCGGGTLHCRYCGIDEGRTSEH